MNDAFKQAAEIEASTPITAGSIFDLDAPLAIVRRRTPGRWELGISETLSIHARDTEGGYSDDIVLDGGDENDEQAMADMAAIQVAVNNFEPLAERCQRAEAALERFARSLERAGKDMYDLVGENKRLTRQRDELLAACETLREVAVCGRTLDETLYSAWRWSCEIINRVKGGADGKA